MSNGFETVKRYMPQHIAESLEKLDERTVSEMTELRLRACRPVSVSIRGRTVYLQSGGRTTAQHIKSDLIVSAEEISSVVKSLSRCSLYRCGRELSQGFFTIERGVRAGLSGTVSSDASHIDTVTGLNFRISREIKGCAEEIFNMAFADGKKSILICGAVNSGKTTYLRDICRLIGNRYRTVLIDERNEISASYGGRFGFDTGVQTDVISGGERHSGIISALRSLSPEYIICDEICTEADAEAVLSAWGCGVKFAATVHAETVGDLRKRPPIRRLMDAEIFDTAFFLSGREAGKIKETAVLRDHVSYSRSDMLCIDGCSSRNIGIGKASCKVYGMP